MNTTTEKLACWKCAHLPPTDPRRVVCTSRHRVPEIDAMVREGRIAIEAAIHRG